MGFDSAQTAQAATDRGCVNLDFASYSHFSKTSQSPTLGTSENLTIA